ncbi:MAG: integrase arm-type DNA-binding domain-containing protein [Beijerinckiaceae bacterium]
MLTDIAIRTAKTDRRRLKLSDAGGLQLMVYPTGRKTWLYAYRLDGKQREVVLGQYPDMSLKDAREALSEARKLREAGRDPAGEKRAVKAAAAVKRSNSFAAIADELIAQKRKEGLRPRTMAKVEWLLRLAKDDLGMRPIAELTAGEVLASMRKLEDRGRAKTAVRLRSTISEVFRFAVATGRAQIDPAEFVRGAIKAPKAEHRAAILDRKGLGELLRSIRGYTGRPETRIALELLALTACRVTELRLAEWSEFDLYGAEWTVPASRMKQGLAHRIALAPQTVALLRELHALTGRYRLAFPGVRIPDRGMSENTLAAALRGLGYGSDQMSCHGFRAVFTSFADECNKWSRGAIDLSIAHTEKNTSRKAYARSDRWLERQQLARWWANELDAMRSSIDRVVVPLKKA